MNLTVEESEFIPCDVFDTTRVLKRRNPQAAVRFVEPFAGSVKLLSTMPAIGVARGDLGAPETRSWRIKGFRNYLIFMKSRRIDSACCASCTAIAIYRLN